MRSPESYSVERPRREYCFADFTLDLDRGLLKRGGEEVTLRPKAFEVLAYLVEHHGSVVTKTALTGAVWPDAAITDNSLAQCLVEIRRALADDSQQLIRTLARRGYVFAAPVTTPIVEFPRQPTGRPTEPGPLPAPPSQRVARSGGLAAAGRGNRDCGLPCDCRFNLSATHDSAGFHRRAAICQPWL